MIILFVSGAIHTAIIHGTLEVDTLDGVKNERGEAESFEIYFDYLKSLSIT